MPLDPRDSPGRQDQNAPPPPVREGGRRLGAVALIALCLILLLTGVALLQRDTKWGSPVGILLIVVAIFGIIFGIMQWESWRRQASELPRQDRAATSATQKEDQTAATTVSPPVSSVPSAESPASAVAAVVSIAQDTGVTRDGAVETQGDGDVPVGSSRSPGPPSQAAAVQPKNFSRRHARPVDSRHGGYLLDQSGTDSLFLLAGSAVGVRHDQPGLMREDDVAFYALPAPPSTIVAAVADGVGSSRHSHIASALAVPIAVNELSSRLAVRGRRGVFSDWAQTANELVATVSDALSTELLDTAYPELIGTSQLADEDYKLRPGRPAATLAVVVVREEQGRYLASWLTVGDCDVIIADLGTDNVEWLTNHAYRRGPRTEAVPSHRKVTRCSQDFIADGQVIVATTDGMAEVLGGGGWPALKPALAAARQRDSALADLLTALDVRQHGNYDDRSLIAIGPIGWG